MEVVEWNFLFNTFPREIAFPQRVITNSFSEFREFVKNYNGMTNLYYALYSLDSEKKFNKIVIDKIAFDFDAEELINSWNETKKMMYWLSNKKYFFLLFFSGKKGFHIIILTKNGNNLNYPKDALMQTHKFISSESNTKPDPKLFGDVRRILRIPGSKHLGSGNFCIPLSIEEFMKGPSYILSLASKPRWKMFLNGEKYFDLANFDKPYYNNIGVEIPKYNYKIKIENDKLVDSFLPCVKSWLLNEKNNDGEEMGNWQARYLFAIYCRDIGLPISEAKRIAKKYFGKVKRDDGNWTNYDHMLKVRVFDYAYNRKNDLFWNCDTLYSRGLCKGKCKFYKENGSPLYK